MATLVLISGKARAGKDTLAQYLKDNNEFTVMHWAAPMKKELTERPHNFAVSFNEYTQEATCYIDQDIVIDKELARRMLYWMSGLEDVNLDYNREDAMSPGYKPYFIETYALYGYMMKEKDRELLQWYGTDYKRKHKGQDYWINLVMPEIINNLLQDKDVVVPDTRFLNEIQTARACGNADKVIIVRVKRDGIKDDSEGDDQHKSETELDSYAWFDLTIKNNKDIDGFTALFEKELESFV